MLNGLLLPLLVAMFLGLNMGGSGTAPSFATAFGSGIIRRSLIPGLFGIFVLLGALLAGKNTRPHIGERDTACCQPRLYLNDHHPFFGGTFPAFCQPDRSASIDRQTTVVALVAPAHYVGQLNTHKIFFEIIPTWIIMPIISFGLMYFISMVISKRFDLKHPGYFSTEKRQRFFNWVVIITAVTLPSLLAQTMLPMRQGQSPQ